MRGYFHHATLPHTTSTDALQIHYGMSGAIAGRVTAIITNISASRTITITDPSLSLTAGLFFTAVTRAFTAGYAKTGIQTTGKKE
jgi:uncharacterized YccA/Bax inhibitor family protein